MSTEDKLKEFLGLSEEPDDGTEYIRQQVLEALVDDLSPSELNAVEDALAGGPPVHIHRCPDGCEGEVHLVIDPDQGDDDEVGVETARSAP